MQTLIQADSISKTFGEGTEKRAVLDGISLEIRQGEFVSVMGPSGSGKSTLLYALSGMDSVDSGSILFEGEMLTGLHEAGLADLRRTRMGFVFQQPTLLKHLDILDNILLPSLRDGRRNLSALRARAKSLMEKTGIAGLEKRSITQASGGQLQRVGICRAMMGEPRIIFADEPTGALNSATAGEIMDIFDVVHRAGVTILMVTHDVRVAARAHRVIYLLDGKIAGELSSDTSGAAGRSLHEREQILADWLAGMEL
ncbi:MAG: ABC transporter ATP-binding protein [Spirochaetes bacterium]|nr:ABC transporter ATP-binding protein [Spirochaetota bacterium]